MAIRRIDPIMRVGDVARSVAYYRDLLGFTLEELSSRGDQALFARLRRDGAYIVLVAGDLEKKRALSGLYLEVDDIAAIYGELLASGAEPDPIHPTRHGTAEVDVTDPEGHIVTFGQPIHGSGIMVPEIFDIIERGDHEALAKRLESEQGAANTMGYFWWWGGNHWTALEVAAAHGQLECARLLLDHGADVNGGDAGVPLDWTPLQLSSFTYPEVAKLLLDRGAEIDVFSVAGVGDSAALAEGLTVQPELAKSVGPDGATPLHFAAAGCHLDCVRILLAQGADALALDADGETPAEWGHTFPEIVEALGSK
ncbi:MAG: ankyrin repeat domain-containing protein [Deltaproteobacteria bacterium]|nr:ankyrin repeat domain-containing protein [Deltaproteobacteria bacterium]